MSAGKPTVFLIGLTEDEIRLVQPILIAANTIKFDSKDVEQLVENPPTEAPALILCGKNLEGMSPFEVAQFLRSQFQDLTIYFISKEWSPFEKASLKKNGFSDSFLLSLDQGILKDALSAAMAKASNNKAFRPVKIIDIQPNTVLDFDISVYLPANNKFLRYASSGDELGSERSERMAKHKISSVYVTQDQMDKFYSYTAKRLRELGSDGGISETERRERMQNSVRDLMAGILGDSSKEGTFEHGKAMVTDCQQIVSNYIQASSDGDWYKQIMKAIDDTSNTYSHAGNVATYSALFSMGLGLGKPEDMAIAGMLHDIGLVKVPIEIQNKEENERTKEEAGLYRKHVEYSIEVIKTRKLILSDNIMKAIAQHHEWWNGMGYPNGLAGKRISIEGQILALADYFDHLISVKPGKPRTTPAEAIKKMQDEMNKDPGQTRFDPELVRKLVVLFPSQ